MIKFLMVIVVLIALVVLLFAVPPALSAQDTVTVLLGFLGIVVSVGCALGALIYLLDGGKK